jgi:hypothetical protein
VGSTLALSLALADGKTAPSTLMRRIAFRRRLVRIGEPPKSRLPHAEWDALLRRTGWSMATEVEPRALDPGAGFGSRLVTAAVAEPSG